MRIPQTLHKEDPESLWLVDPLHFLISSLLFRSIKENLYISLYIHILCTLIYTYNMYIMQ